MDKRLETVDEVFKKIGNENKQDAIDRNTYMRYANKNKQQAKEIADSARQMIYDIANPHPVLVALCIVGSLLILYLIYYVWFMDSLEGHWFDKNGMHWHFYHNRLTGKIKCEIRTGNLRDVVMYGELVKNKVVLYLPIRTLTGIWDGLNKIILENGILLTRSVN